MQSVETFAPGTVVRLRSGGFKMTVVRHNVPNVEVTWMSTAGELQTDRVDQAVLIRVDGD